MSYFARPQSSAVKIVKPPSNGDDAGKAFQSPGTPGTTTPKKDSTQRQCRNIVIYGHCKYQDKGCIYYHPPTTPEPPATPPPPTSGGKRPESPVLGTLSAQTVNAPVFVPKSAVTIAAAAAAASSPGSPTTSRPSTSHGATVEDPFLEQDTSWQDYPDSETSYGQYSYHPSEEVDGISQRLDEYYDDGYASHHYDEAAAYFASAPAPVFIRQPLHYHLYTPTTAPDFVPSTTNTHFVPPSSDLRQLLQERSETTRGIALAGLSLPEELQGYHTIVPLEMLGAGGVERRKFGNWFTSVYRAIKASDGLPYILRRIENYRLMNPAAFASVDFWSNLKHPSIVGMKEAFTTRAFDDNSLVVVYAYHPNAETLYDVHLKQSKPTAGTATATASTFSQRNRFQSPSTSQYNQQQTGLLIGQQPPIPERTMWSYIVQIASAIKKVHEAGHAIRSIDANKILLTSQNRIRLSICGTMDILMHDTPQDVHLLQQDDLTQFGRLIFALCCGVPGASSGPHFQKSIDHLLRFYGQEMKSLALWLISKTNVKSIDSVLDSIRHRVLQEQEDALSGVDRLEHELQGELENARLVRLMTKFGFINERPEFAREPRWSETGDRYIVKLFRDYVFHQVDEHGNPVLDMSHVLSCLNKLDAGTDEKIMLVARDEQSCLVVSYKDVRTCIDGAYNDLAKAAMNSPAAYKHR